MSLLWRFTLWTIPAFLVCWYLHAPYEQWIGSVAARLAAPRGLKLELLELEVFYPFDLGIFIALCLATSAGSKWRRWRAVALGTPLLVLVEILVLTASLRILLATEGADFAGRLVNSMVRFEGLMAAAIAWAALLAWPRAPKQSKAARSSARARATTRCTKPGVNLRA